MILRKNLNDIGLECGTDKASHGYLDFYDDLFSVLRTQPVSILEIGVAGGESIRMWSEYFIHPFTKIYGVEIQDKPLPVFDPRINIFITDATSPNAVFDITQAIGSLDIIVDDGGHFSSQQKSALSLWWPHLKSGGILSVEDTHTSYHYPWTIPDEVSFVSSMMEWIHRLNENGLNQSGVPAETDIEEIIFRKSLCVIRKQ